MGVNGTGTILFLAQTDTLGRRLDDDRGINNARQMEGDAPRVITRTVDEELSRNFFFFSLFFPHHLLSSSFLSLIFPSHLSLSLPPFSGEQWRQWERVLSRFIVHCLVCGKVNLSASGHELRFIRRVKFGDKGRGFKSMEMPIGNYFSLLS